MMAEFDPDAFLAAPAAALAFDPDAFLKSESAPAPTGRERQHAYREALRAGPPEQPAGQAAPGPDLSGERNTAAQLGEQWGQVGKGIVKGVPATIAGGMVGDLEHMGRRLGKEFGADQHTAIPTTGEGGYLGPRGAGMMDEAKNKYEGLGMGLGAMAVPMLPKVPRAVRSVREGVQPTPFGPQPAPAIETVNKMTGKPAPEPPALPMAPPDAPSPVPRPNTNVRLLPSEVPHAPGGEPAPMPQRASVGAAGRSPLEDVSPPALQRLREVMREQGLNEHTLDQRLEEMSPHQFLFELTPNLEVDAQGIAGHTGHGRFEIVNSLRERAREQRARLNNVFDQYLGRDSDVAQNRRVLEIEQKKAADPLYRRFRDTKIFPTPEIKELLPILHEVPGLFSDAQAFARIKRVPWQENFFTTGEQKAFPTAQTWDLVKQALDAKIEASYGPLGRPTKWTSAYTQLKNELVNALDNHPDPNVNGLYRQARAAYAGPEQIKRAQRFGQELLTRGIDADELPFVTATYGAEELNALRIGTRKYLKDILGNPGRVERRVMNEILGENNQRKLQWVLGEEEANGLVRSIQHEFDMHEAPHRVTGGSPTGHRITAINKWGGPGESNALDDLASFAHKPTRTIIGKTMESVNKRINAAAEREARQVRDELARVMTLQGPERDAVLRWLVETDQAERPNVHRWPGAAEKDGGRVNRKAGGKVLALRRRAEGGEVNGEVVDPFEAAAERTRRSVISPRLPAPRDLSREYDYLEGTPEKTETPGVMNKLFGVGTERYQMWPEKMVRGALNAPGVAADATPGLRREDFTDIPGSGFGSQPNDQLVEAAQDLSGVAGGGMFGRTSGVAARPNIGDTAVTRQLPPPHMDATRTGPNEWSLLSDSSKPGAPIAALAKQQMGPAPVFYSALEQAVIGAKLQKAHPKQWEGYLKNQPGIKAEELELIQPWLKKQQGLVTREQVAEAIRENKVEPQEVWKTGKENWSVGDKDRLDELERNRRNLTDEEEAEFQDLVSRENDASEKGTGKPPDMPKYGPESGSENLNVPGGDNYRELLLQMPETGKKDPGYPGYWIEEAYNQFYVKKPYLENTQIFETRREAENYIRQQTGREPGYVGSHWDEPNVLAHARMDDREIGGRRSLFLQEVQSDWHQQGRKKGYADEDSAPVKRALTAEEARLVGAKAGDEWYVVERAGRIIGVGESADEAKAYAGTATKGVPDAPFKTSWPDLVLKRMIREAAENGYEQLAWTDGATQAERYNLSKKISKVEWNSRDKTLLAYDHSGKKVVSESNVPPNRVEEFVGKDVAQKLIKSAEDGSSYWGEVSGLDLDVGGEGMKSFYDRELVNKANALGKKYGAKVDRQPLQDVAGYEQAPNGEWFPALADGTRTDGPTLRVVKSPRFNSVWEVYTGDGKFQNALGSEREAIDWIKSQGKPTQAWVLPITPELREAAVGKGFALFSDSGMAGKPLAALGKQEKFRNDPNNFLMGVRGGMPKKGVFPLNDKNEGMLYHVAPTDRVPIITKEGLSAQPDENKQWVKEHRKNDDHVYAFVEPASAYKHAMRQAERTGQPQSLVAVKVDITDKGQLTDWSQDLLLHDGRRFRDDLGAVKKQGNVSPDDIKDIFNIKYPKKRAAGGRVDPSNINHAPTEAQKKAGNYAKDHVVIHGLDVTIENAQGRKRSGVNKGGKPWSVVMPAHYGYIKRTRGADDDHVDCYVGPNRKSPWVFIVDQCDATTGKFDEHKCFLGFATMQQAVNTYKKAFSDGKGEQRCGHVNRMTVEGFKDWLANHDTTKPLGV